ncbi:hypothetical protein [Aureimonas sp. AU4]|uniref:hypothetical protein n=1 Tax=Aureimonas sp. AU4 TaxID=1638163 RepID=UPI000705AE2E|nr:hypothetical protein [Aureimonas sp. AU4]BAT30342.1 hypothetical protein [Aureimonas sp. AU4]
MDKATAGPAAYEARFRRHPALHEAVDRYTGAILEVREGVAYAFKLLSKEERYRAFMIFALMSAMDEDREGLPNSLYSGYCEAAAGISKRTAQTMLQLLVHYGFAQMRIDPADRRSRLYRAEPKIVQFLSDWIEASLKALRLLDVPAAHEATPRQLMPALTVSGSDAYAQDGYVFFPDPDFRHLFAEIEGGSLVVMAVMAKAREGGPGPTRGELARRFHMSRAQVTRIVAVGRESGLFGSDEAGTPTVTPRLEETYLDCILKALSFLAFHYENGLRLGGGPKKLPGEDDG